jgi:hypothetical protein
VLGDKKVYLPEPSDRAFVWLFSLQCYTQQEIAEQIGLSLGRVGEMFGNIKSDICLHM